MADWTQDVRARLSPLRLSPAREADIIDELSQHLELRYQDSLAAGATPDEARRLALAEFQSDDVLARQMARLRQAYAPRPLVAGERSGSVWGDVWLDLRYAARVFSKQRGFAAGAVLTLALGIGATTAIFSVVYGVLLKPLPFAGSDRLVTVRHHAPHGAGTNHGLTTYLTYRENQQAFEAIGAWDPTDVSITGSGGDPERAQALMVSASTLPLLRVQPLLGRFFGAEDDVPGTPLRVVLTHGFWQRRFGGANTAIGQQLLIDGRQAEVIGVLPSSFMFLRTRPAIVLPLPLDAAAPRGISFGFQALARLGPGVTLARANDDLKRLISLLPPAFGRLELQPNVRPLADDVIGGIGQVLWLLMAAVGVVLLVACGNVANLFLVRAEGRYQELAMRTALGASRGRIARALLSESVLLAFAGGLLGLVLTAGGIALLRAVAPAELPRVDEIGIDTAVLLFALSISAASGLLFGVFAVFRFRSPNLAAIKDAGRAVGDAPGRQRTRSALVVGQIALALTLLIVAGLMVRTVVAMRDVEPGFVRPQDIQTFTLAIPEGLIRDPQEAARTHERVAERLSAVPGVASVGLSSSVTMDGEDNGNPVEVEGFSVPAGQLTPLRRFKSVGPGYFETMGNPLAAGRPITWGEIHERRPVIVISAALAREYWGEPVRALGQRIRSYGRDPGPWREIVGVSADERDDGVNRPATAIVYWPMLSEGYRWRTMVYAVRSTRVGTPEFVRELERAVWSVNPELPLAGVRTVAKIQATSMAQTSFAMVMLALAASVALLIGTIGIYGVIAYTAAQRTREIGVRMALGAQTRDVRTMFLRHGLWLTAAGIALGVGVAALLSRVMSSLLFGVAAVDVVTYAAVSAILAAIALVATYLPARRASRVDPIAALRANG
jgi:predicted permease